MAEKDWQKVLRVIYEEDIIWSMDADYDEDHPVVEATGMEPGIVQDKLAFLSQTGLVGRVQAGLMADVSRPGKEGVIPIADADRGRGTHLGLTSDGFRVMHERNTNLTRHQTNFALVVLTLGLFGASMVQAVGEMYSPPTSKYVSVGVLVLMLGAAGTLWIIDWGISGDLGQPLCNPGTRIVSKLLRSAPCWCTLPPTRETSCIHPRSPKCRSS